MKPLLLVLSAGILFSTFQAQAQQTPQGASSLVRIIKIELVGDSTQTKTAGYGLGFCANLTGPVECINDAKGGAST